MLNFDLIKLNTSNEFQTETFIEYNKNNKIRHFRFINMLLVQC